ncbi:MAG: uncharacterized membrane protein YgdD (TMEM256/DUF423 family) [Arcticibacterium sp.]|jgi:uncharacterized membrane protein YgdD (TMEM256/DUF423 family)
MNKKYLISGAVLGFLAVGLGAFGAHALKESLLAAGNLETYNTAVEYLFYHALALLFTGILTKEFDNKWNNYAGFAFLIGSIIFSGSLFLICLTGVKTFGAVAPIGGTFLILGWLSCLRSFLVN